MLTPVGGEDGQVRDAVVIEVGHADDLRRARVSGRRRDWRTGLLPGPRARRGCSMPGLIVTRLGRAAGRERPGGDAGRRFQAGDLGRAAGVDRGQPGPGAIGLGGAKTPSPQLRRTLTWPVSLLVTTRSRRPFRWCRPPGRRRRPGRRGGSPRRQERASRPGPEVCRGVVAEDRERAIAGVADDQVVPAVAIEVGRDDLRRQAAGRRASRRGRSRRRARRRARRRRRGRRRWRAAGLPGVRAPRRCRARGSRG